MYLQGNETKQCIINTAKDIFYERGFLNTSISSIMTKAGIRRSLFFYYFKDNFDLAKYIYDELQDVHFKMIQKIIDANESIKLNALEMVTIRGISHLRLVLSDKKIARFISEVSYKGAIWENEFIKRSFSEITEHYLPEGKNIPCEFLSVQILALSACIFRLYADGDLNMSLNDVLGLKTESNLRNMYVADEDLERIKQKCLDVEKQIELIIEPNFNVKLIRAFGKDAAYYDALDAKKSNEV